MKNKIILSAVMFSMFVGLGFVGSSYAATTPTNSEQRAFPQRQGHNSQTPGVFGTVSAINGTNLTVVSRGFGPNSATTTYTVDASNAIVQKDRATSTLSVINVDSSVMVSGTINETLVTATRINLNAGFGEGNMQNPGKDFDPKNASSTDMIEGNGQPIIGGTVSSINGTTITITNKSNVNYTIDASNATITKENNKISESDIAVGDSVLVQGTINGTSVVATSITDQIAGTRNADNSKQSGNKLSIGGFFGGIGNFFAKLFGF